MSTPNKAAVGRPLHDNQFDVAVSMVEFDDDDEGCKTPPELAHDGDAAAAAAAAHAIRIGGADQVKRVNEADARTQMRQLAPRPAAAAPAASGGAGSLDADQVAAAAAALAAMRHAADAVASARKAIEGRDLGESKPKTKPSLVGASSSNEAPRASWLSSSSKSDADTVDSDDEGAKAMADSDAKEKPASPTPALAHAPPEVQARFARLDVGDRTAWHEYSHFEAKAGMHAARETANKPEDVAFDLEESADFVPTPPGEREHPSRGITLADCNHAAVDDKEKATADKAAAKAAAAEASAVAAAASKESPPTSDDDDDEDGRVPPPPKVSRQDAGAPPRGLFGAPDVAQQQQPQQQKKKGEVLKGQVHDLAVSASMDYSLSAQYSIATDAGLGGGGGATRSSLGAPPVGDKKGISVGESKKLHATVLKNQAMDLAFSVSASADFSQPPPAKKDGVSGSLVEDDDGVDDDDDDE